MPHGILYISPKGLDAISKVEGGQDVLFWNLDRIVARVFYEEVGEVLDPNTQVQIHQAVVSTTSPVDLALQLSAWATDARTAPNARIKLKKRLGEEVGGYVKNIDSTLTSGVCLGIFYPPEAA